jgi:hypothetical protein
MGIICSSADFVLENGVLGLRFRYQDPFGIHQASASVGIKRFLVLAIGVYFGEFTFGKASE